MSSATSEILSRSPHSQDARWERTAGNGWSSSESLLTGLVVVALGALVWYYVGPDLIRYLKIRSM